MVKCSCCNRRLFNDQNAILIVGGVTIKIEKMSIYCDCGCSHKWQKSIKTAKAIENKKES